ncbi:TPA: AAA family ATPase, partial [Acinetobacter baumannii]|nr:AAA family ATPase [Acinetobacter baumannii]
MKIISANIKNFRKLENVSLSFDEKTTVIVGRNNTGKTSTAEIFRSFLSGNSPNLKYVDFCHSSFAKFIEAAKEFKANPEDEIQLRNLTPSIDLELILDYTSDADDYGVLSEFIIDLDENLFQTKILVTYKLKDGEIYNFYSGLETDDLVLFYPNLKKKIGSHFESVAFVIDPSNEENRIKIDFAKIRKLLLVGVINAQRGLDDETYSERDVLGKSLGTMFNNASSTNAPQDFQDKSQEIKNVVDQLQFKVDTEFQEKVSKLLPQLTLFGYPGIDDKKLSASTELNVKTLLDSHTKVYYKHDEHFSLPETYNGLGFRNLIYILFRVYEFFIEFQSQHSPPKGQIIFIEEPEAHLHPQMQEVFISQLDKIINVFQEQLGEGRTWPIQFVVSTHSSHIANKADFSQIRYFLSKNKNTRIKDLGNIFKSQESKEDKEFLQKYLTLTKCDLYFADIAILIEGTTERILLPEIIKKVDLNHNTSITQQYLSIVEVGGAYAHHFYKFLDFLELKTLIITDLDACNKVSKQDKNGRVRTSYKSCIVSDGTHSTNSGLNRWFMNYFPP